MLSPTNALVYPAACPRLQHTGPGEGTEKPQSLDHKAFVSPLLGYANCNEDLPDFNKFKKMGMTNNFF